ncbi:MAG: M24 family metallopeptidase [Candidatus Aminicenantia bacterium]
MKRREFLAGGLTVSFSFLARKSIKDQRNEELKRIYEGEIVSITDEERKERIQKAQELMKKNRISCILIPPGTTLRYFTNVSWGLSERFFGFLLPAEGEPIFICPSFEVGRLENQLKKLYEIRTWEEDENPFKLIYQFLKERRIATSNFGIEATVRFMEVDGIAKEAPSINIVPADVVINWCRGIKSEAEIELLRISNEITLNILKDAVKEIYPGMRASEIGRKISKTFAKYGFTGGAMVLCGENSSYPHGGILKDIVLEEGMTVLLDGGTSVEGYRSDVTRTLVFGKPNEKQKKLWEVVKRAQTEAFKTAKPGVKAGDVDKAARTIIENVGFGPTYKYFSHRLGHGVGLDEHEWPYIFKDNPLKLENGMTFSNEPGVYIKGEFGIRLEDCMVIREDGAEFFTPQAESIEISFN